MVEDIFGLVGQHIENGKILVEQVVGEGGFSVVYRGLHAHHQEHVAIKALKVPAHLNSTQQGAFLRMFREEARNLQKLSRHSIGVVQAYDSSEVLTPSGQLVPIVVMEWLAGLPLDKITTQNSPTTMSPISSPEGPQSLTRIVAPGGGDGWPLHWVLALLEQAVHGLITAHAMRIAHRDIKPSNFFLVWDIGGGPTSKILDFGIAKVFADTPTINAASNLNTINAFTAEYAAPEQFNRKHGATGPWTDVYALALIIVELITGQGPPVGWNLHEYYQRTVDPRRPTPGSFGLPLPAGIEQVFYKALAIDPRERFASADLFWRALCAASNYHGKDATLSHDLQSVFQNFLPQASPRPSPIPPTHPDPSPSTPAKKDVHDWRISVVGLGLLGGFVAAVLLGKHLTASSSNLLLGIPAASTSPANASSGRSPGSSAPGFSTPSQSTPAPSVSVDPRLHLALGADEKCSKGMIYIPGGEFMMGSADPEPSHQKAGFDNSRLFGWSPAHKVRLSPFCIDRTEVTVRRYKECPTSTCTLPEKGKTPIEQTYHAEGRNEFPLNFVSFRQARAFCLYVGGDLPTEAQWEFAARGTDGRRYPWGNSDTLTCKDVLPKVDHGQASNMLAAAFGEASDCWPGTLSKGHGPWRAGLATAGASPFGVVDMAGSMMEWTRDCFDASFYKKQSEKTDPPLDPVNEEQGCPDGVVRGGGWTHGGGAGNVTPAWNMRSYWREPQSYKTGDKDTVDAEVGFRCVAKPL